jgi:hypothetical protein
VPALDFSRGKFADRGLFMWLTRIHGGQWFIDKGQTVFISNKGSLALVGRPARGIQLGCRGVTAAETELEIKAPVG